MAAELDYLCPHCKERLTQSIGESLSDSDCPQCHKNSLPYAPQNANNHSPLKQCFVCACPHIHLQKDFNRKLGIALLILGFALAYWTYGLSILALTAIDFWLYRNVSEIGCCYECGAIYRDFATLNELPHFELKLHDYYKSVRGKKRVH